MRDRRPTPVLFAAFAALAVVAAGAAGPSAAAERAELLPPAPGDLVAGALATAAAPLAPDLERRPLVASWPVPPGRDLEGEHRPFVAASRSFTLRVAAAELARGAALPTVSAAAVVRLTPLGGAAAAVDPAALVVVDPRGREHPAGSGVTLPVGPGELAATGAPFAPGSAAFRLRAELGAGRFVLRAPGLDTAGDYLVHVFERDSAAVLKLTTGRDAHLAGETLRAVAELAGDGPAAALGRVEVLAVSPAGRRFPLEMRRVGERRFTGELRLDSTEGMSDGPWRLAARAEGRWGELALRRDAETSFGYAVPTARIGGAALARGGDGLAVGLGLEVAVAGRYEVRGVLYGSDAGGALRPLAVGHAAAWLEPGPGAVELRFDGESLAGSGLGAPYEVRDLRLIDQGRLGLLQRQQRGLRIE